MVETPTGAPEALARIPGEDVVELDVREALRSGQEPFSTIMAAREEVPDGGALSLRAIFEPVPLYGVMARHGFAHWTEKLADDDWRVWFYPEGAEEVREAPVAGGAGDGVGVGVGSPAHASGPSDTTGAADATGESDAGPTGDADGDGVGVVVLDVRGLEPPEPLVRTLAALEELPEGGTLVQINVRVPRFLLPQLRERGFSWEIREQEPDLVRVFIRRAD